MGPRHSTGLLLAVMATGAAPLDQGNVLYCMVLHYTIHLNTVMCYTVLVLYLYCTQTCNMSRAREPGWGKIFWPCANILVKNAERIYFPVLLLKQICDQIFWPNVCANQTIFILKALIKKQYSYYCSKFYFILIYAILSRF